MIEISALGLSITGLVLATYALVRLPDNGGSGALWAAYAATSLAAALARLP